MRLIDADEVKKYVYEVYKPNGVEFETLLVVPLGAINNAQTFEISKALATVDENGDIRMELIRTQNEWISCKDRLPRSIGVYLVTLKLLADIKIIKTCKFHTDLYSVDEYDFAQYKGKKHPGWYYINDDGIYVEAENVIAWMELPKPYEET